VGSTFVGSAFGCSSFFSGLALVASGVGSPGFFSSSCPLVGCGVAPVVGFSGPPAALAGTTASPLNSPGLAVAAMRGLPLLAETKADSVLPATRALRSWSLVGARCLSFAASSSAAVGLASTPLGPPLKLTRVLSLIVTCWL
jgi:hypothetical protein